MESRFTDEEKLNLLLDYYKHLHENYVGQNGLELKFFKNAMHKKQRMIELQFSGYMINLYGFNGFPKVKSDDDFKKMAYPGYFRGVEDVNQHANMLCDYDYHYGTGADGCGLYFAKSYNVVEVYANGENGNVLSAKFTGTILTKEENEKLRNYYSNSISEIKLKMRLYKMQSIDPKDKAKLDALVDYYNSLSAEDQSVFEYMTSEHSFLPIYLEYDALAKPWSGKDETEVLIVYNRSQILVNESEFKRITSASKNYKDGVIDFNKKKDEEFLME